MLKFNNQNNLNHPTQSRRSRGMGPPVRTGWRQWVAIYRQLPHRGGVQLFLLLWDGVQFFLILPNFLCPTCFSFAAWEIFLFNCSFHDEGGMCFAIGNHTYPILLYFVSRFVFIPWKPPSASEQQDKIEWKLCGCFFLSFCHPLFLSFCLLLMPAPGKEGRQVLSCK